MCRLAQRPNTRVLGIPRTADRKHIGVLTYRTDLPAATGGGVRIDAPSAAEAVRNALTGSITVSVGQSEAVASFGPTTVGFTPAAQRPFHAQVSGGLGLIRFEDLAPFANGTADWDYDDRSWQVAVFQPGGGGARGGRGGMTPLSGPQSGGSVIDSGTFTLADMFAQEAKVEYAVWEQAPDVYQWDYVVTNKSINVQSPSHKGIITVSLEVFAAAGV